MAPEPTYDNLDGVLSPFLRNQRLQAARPFLKGRILDYGCGIGLIGELVPQNSYVGVDIDQEILDIAQSRFPEAQFFTPKEFAKQRGDRFDTVVGLAIIEHVNSPIEFLNTLSKYLKPGGRIVLTTPHPSLEWVLHLGDKIGLFAKESHEEHQELLDRKRVVELAAESGMTLQIYKRFLLGANQLIVYQK